LPGLRSDLILPKTGAWGTEVVHNSEPFERPQDR